MSKEHTYREIANIWELWIEYVDTDGNMTRDEFDALTVDEKIAMQAEMFGAE